MFKNLFLLTALATVSLATPAQIEADLTTITTQTTALGNAINSFANPGGTLIQALNIHTSAQRLVSSINKATTDTISTGQLSEADATTILGQVQNLEPLIITGLNNISSKKTAFVALNSQLAGTSALVLQDLRNLNSSTVSFESALLAISPSDVATQAASIIQAINVAFANAITTFAS
ncbi:hypothetical protein AX16_006877 [Volvariella volvacea WC 439]|nr:hypothetical protein AX16_006877 [Volvariella volvacea WC 439]